MKRYSGGAYQRSEVTSSGFSKSIVNGLRNTSTVVKCLKSPHSQILSGFRLKWGSPILWSFLTSFKTCLYTLSLFQTEMSFQNQSFKLRYPSLKSKYPYSTTQTFNKPSSFSSTMLWARICPLCHAQIRASNLSRCWWSAKKTLLMMFTIDYLP